MGRTATLRHLAALASALLLGGCASGVRIPDFTDRSLAYGWLNIDDVDANRLHSVSIHQFSPQTAESYHPAAVKAFRNGFLYYSMALPNGAHRTDSASGQRCVAFECGTTVYRYSLGKQGDDADAVVVAAPGVYYLGSHRMKEIRTGFLEHGGFEVLPAPDAPSRREMLEEILKDARAVPVVAERIRRELARMR